MAFLTVTSSPRHSNFRMGKRFREFFVKYAALPGACGMLIEPAKRLCLPRQPVRGEDLVAFYDELESHSGDRDEASDSEMVLEPEFLTENDTAVAKMIVAKANPNRRKAETRLAEDKENNQRNRMTSTDRDADPHKQTDTRDAEKEEELTSSGFLVTVLSDCE